MCLKPAQTTAKLLCQKQKENQNTKLSSNKNSSKPNLLEIQDIQVIYFLTHIASEHKIMYAYI